MTNTDLLPPVYIGLPQWQHSRWPKHWFAEPAARQRGLFYYARQLNTIEGNTTFYSLPDMATVTKWAQDTPADFRFTFKLHQSITHSGALDPHHPAIAEQLALLQPLAGKLALVMVQLPASFAPQQLRQLDLLLAELTPHVNVAVEVRHLAFFSKGDEERALNQLLISHQANRVIMDTRGLFAGPADCELTAEVRTKKPKVPVNVIATGDKPVLRFVGGNDDTVNQEKLAPWIHKCHAWRQEGKTPFLFFHRPDNGDAPWLAAQFIRAYNRQYANHALPELCFPGIENHSQATLF